MLVTRLFFFFFNDTATTEIYTLSLHDALPIYRGRRLGLERAGRDVVEERERPRAVDENVDRKSTRLNSSHLVISYAVFCLKKKKTATPLTIHIAATAVRVRDHTVAI